ncbi:VanZ family protein [Arthrobacter psychrolactophilus]|uniref:VanZ family protein n=1 Tax=Arthrobacter psychrolactophilus TaxID=92442 RepID=A0A2V5ILT9_9MICC|nr:VanZ family protein [Arthrobacter psychrolactophilus]PYI37599.1 VanZ family protein [Arthrobacter psychrolactophilus]
MIKRHHRIAMAAAILYLLAVLLVVFWPTPVDRPASGTLNAVLSWLHRHGTPRFIDYNFVEFTANIAMFIPMGLIASIWFKNGFLGVIAGMLVSCLIELTQATSLPDRYATGLDILANSIGAGLGALAFYLGHRRLSK